MSSTRYDRNISEVAGQEQRWIAHGWHARFGLAADPNDTGYNHTAEQAADFPAVPADTILAYHDAVVSMIEQYLNSALPDDLVRVSTSPTRDPSSTVAERLTKEVSEGFQHLGQIQIS